MHDILIHTSGEDPIDGNLEPGTYRIGSSPASHIQIERPEIAAYHAVIHVKDDALILVDGGSPNGTRLNGEPCVAEEDYSLSQGDVIGIGPDVTIEIKSNRVQAALPTQDRFIGPGWFEDGISWIKGQEQGMLTIGAVFQLVVLIVMILIPFITLTTGDTILLRVRPVDPRDMFRGDYVILSYSFSRFRPQDVPKYESTNTQGRTVYVSLVPEKDGEHWRMGKFSFEKPSTEKFLRGKIKGRNQVEFGIESYFVQEGKGLEYEKAVRKRKLSAEIALDRNGKAVLKRLVIN